MIGRPRKATPEEIAKVRELRAKGMGAPEIAKQINRPAATVQRWCERYRIKLIPKGRELPVRTTEIDPRGLTTDEIAQAVALRAAGLTYGTIGRTLGRAGSTIKRLCEEPGVAAQIAEKKEPLSDYFEETAYRMVASISEADIARINAYQRLVSAGIAVDKMRLLRGQSTENIAILALIEQLDREDREVVKEREVEALAPSSGTGPTVRSLGGAGKGGNGD